MTTTARNNFLATVSSVVQDATVTKVNLLTTTTPSAWTALITRTSADKFSIGQTVYGMANPVDIWLSK
ncbi:TOBE domain-containing protein [Sporomusa sp. KB1]|jgi:molybdopterin-binding protein|uniref:TOBE domain-containing protein n=1 Tax=Sporomusa sp. KB1 TaxID=943346 RepID=UPI0011A4F8E6|nr:TOBE domain-containing protein [Sporomusa sp. KB1]TWH47590.1 TOBE domain-containing protein [Sporomusa sp. KB1]